MSFSEQRRRATISVCALALTLAGCNAQRSDELAANVAAGAPIEASSAPGGGDPQAAGDTVNLAIPGVPLPPVRPDFEKLAKANPEAAPVQDGATVIAQSQPSAPPKPAGIFAIFMGAPADPGAPGQVAIVAAMAAPAAASDAPPASGSLAAYERRMAGDEPADTRPVQATPRIVPGATIEVNGVIRQLPNNASPVLIAPSPRVAASFGAMSGERWRPAYDTVVTNCFPADLRRALNIISEHFNSEVLVTSGARANGRRRSMHRSCRAADIRVAGVSPGTVARYASSVPGINGVGTYRRVAVTHIDTRENRMAWRY